MTHSRFSLAALCLGVFLSVAAGSAAHAAADRSEVIERVISHGIRPGFEAFAGSAERLAAATHQLCSAPDAEKFAATTAAFADLIDSWSRVEFIRLGPLAADNRLERVMFWPDRRSRGLAQVQEAIRTGDDSVTDPVALAGKSVALQGLPALDFVLAGTGSEEIAAGTAPMRCAFAAAIADNVSDIAGQFTAEWNDPDGFSRLWLEPDALNPMFRDGDEQLSRLLTMIGDGIELIHVQRLEPVVQDSRKAMKPKAALFWRSGNFGRTLGGNIEGLESLFVAAQLQDLVPASDARRLDGTLFGFHEARAVFAEVPGDIAGLATDEAGYNRLAYGDIVLTGLIDNFKETIPVMFGLISGFSTLDGD